jgi:hypothetical protein
MKHIGIFFVMLLTIIAGVSSCGESAKEKKERITQDSIRRCDSLLILRKEIYEVAVSAITKILKVPATARFPAITVQNDTVKLQNTDSKAWVVFPYDAENPKRTYEHYYGTVLLYKWNGKWEADSGDFNLNASAPLYQYTDFEEIAPFKIGLASID